MSEARQLAQFNVARLRIGRFDPRMLRFGLGARAIRAAARRAPGHCWSAQDFLPGNWLATRSVWASAGALEAFVYDGIHRRYLVQSARWFEASERVNMVLWTVAPGARPTLAEARARLEQLRVAGPTQQAFDFPSAPRWLASGPGA